MDHCEQDRPLFAPTIKGGQLSVCGSSPYAPIILGSLFSVVKKRNFALRKQRQLKKKGGKKKSILIEKNNPVARRGT